MRDSVKSGNVCALSVCMDETFADIKQTDKRFGEVLQKWKTLFYSTVKKISVVGDLPEFDVFQELMAYLTRINIMYPVDLYRYKNKVYELSRIDGFNVRLVPSRFNVRQRQALWVRKERIEKVKKASLSSLIYRKIQQQSSVMLRAIFTQKNGYAVVSTEDGYAKMRNGEYGKKFQNIKKNNVVKIYDEISLDSSVKKDEGLTLKDVVEDVQALSAEDECVENELIRKMLSRLSGPSQRVFRWMFMNPESSNREMQKSLKMSKRKLSYAQREITQTYLWVTKQHHRSTYAPYVIFNGNYFYYLDEDGDYIIMGGGAQKHYVHKGRVRIEKELSYRTPVHLPASMVA